MPGYGADDLPNVAPDGAVVIAGGTRCPLPRPGSRPPHHRRDALQAARDLGYSWPWNGFRPVPGLDLRSYLIDTLTMPNSCRPDRRRGGRWLPRRHRRMRLSQAVPADTTVRSPAATVWSAGCRSVV